MDAPDDLIRAELVPGEQLLWAGRPRQGIVIRSGDFMAIPMGCAWCAGVGFAVVFAVREGNWPFALGALAFGMPGLYLLFGRSWLDAFQRSRTAYAVTDRRLLFVRRLPRLVVGSQVRSFNLVSIAAVTLRERWRGTGGTITFGGRTREEAWAAMSGIPGADDYHLPTFELDQGAREVYSLVLAAQQGAGPRP